MKVVSLRYPHAVTVRCPAGAKQTITVSCCWESIKCPVGSISKQHSYPNYKNQTAAI